MKSPVTKVEWTFLTATVFVLTPLTGNDFADQMNALAVAVMVAALFVLLKSRGGWWNL